MNMFANKTGYEHKTHEAFSPPLPRQQQLAKAMCAEQASKHPIIRNEISAAFHPRFPTLLPNLAVYEFS
jgi:hypothetical protein